MMRNPGKISITVRSFIPPHESLKGYELGRPFKMELPRGLTLGGLAQKILGKNIDQLGISAVNGQLAKENLILSGEDKIDFFALIEGG
jgi:hypothetical protein